MGDAAKTLGVEIELSVSHPKWIQRVDLAEQPVFVFPAEVWLARQDIEIRMLDLGSDPDPCIVDARKFGRLAIRVSLRDGVVAVDIRDLARNLAEESVAD